MRDRVANSNDLGLFYVLPKDVLLLIFNMITAQQDGWRLLMPFFYVNGGTYSYLHMKGFTDRLKVNIDFNLLQVQEPPQQMINQVFNFSDINYVLMRNYRAYAHMEYPYMAQVLEKYSIHSSNPKVLSKENEGLLIEIEQSIKNSTTELINADYNRMCTYEISMIVAVAAILYSQDLLSISSLLLSLSLGSLAVLVGTPNANKEIELLEKERKSITAVQPFCIDSRNRVLRFKKRDWWFSHSIDINKIESDNDIKTLLDVNKCIADKFNPHSPAVDASTDPSPHSAVVKRTQNNESVSNVGATLFAIGAVAGTLALSYAMSQSRRNRPN